MGEFDKVVRKLFLSLIIFVLAIICLLFGVVLCIEQNQAAYAIGKNISITANDKQQVYNTETLSLDYTISGDELTAYEEELLDIRLLKEEGGDAGEYVITVYCNDVADITVTKINGCYTITKAIFDTRDLFFQNQTFTYDGNEKSIFLDGYIPPEVFVLYASNNQTQAGQYLVSAIFSSTDNYDIVGGTLYATLIIEKAIIDIGGMVFNNGVFTYDGTPKSIKVVGSIPDTVSIRYQGNLAQSVGSYRVTATIDYYKNNYRLFSGEYEMVKNSLYADIIINKAKSCIIIEQQEYIKTYDGTVFNIPFVVEGEDKRNVVFVINEHLGSNKFVDVGSYNVTITTIGNNNYLGANNVFVKVKILTPFLSQQNMDISFLNDVGFEDGSTIVVTQTDSAMISTKQSPFRKIAAVYTILLFNNGEFQKIPANTTVVIAPPEGRNLDLFFNNSGQGEQIDFTYNSQNKIVFQTDELGMFVIYQDDFQLYWIIGLLICIFAILVLIVIIIIYRSKTFRIDFTSNIIDYNIAPIIAGIGQDISIPQAKFGTLVFDGWYLDDTLKNKLIKLDTMPKKDLKLYAKWAYRPIGKYHKFTDLDIF